VVAEMVASVEEVAAVAASATVYGAVPEGVVAVVATAARSDSAGDSVAVARVVERAKVSRAAAAAVADPAL
jgi:hypothetical protein